MPRQKRVPEIEYGTLPTPASPEPSNVIVETYTNKTVIFVPPPTDSVLTEYERAIKDAPEDAGLRVEYGITLKRVGNLSAGIEQLNVAVQLKPEWAYAHNMLAALLNAQGEYSSVIAEYREALRLMDEENDEKNSGAEAIARSGLVAALKQAGEVQEARSELEHAIRVQERLIDRKAGSKQELKRLTGLLKTYI